MEEIINAYYSDNARKLHKVVDGILLKLEGVWDGDREDFYSLANEVFVGAMKNFDDSRSFDAFLYSCLLKKIKTEITRRNRYKRRGDMLCISLDAPLGEDDARTAADIIADSFDMDRVVFGDKTDEGRKIGLYLDRLSRNQRKIVELLAADYKACEIQKMLQITPKEYSDAMAGIHSYENISVLF